MPVAPHPAGLTSQSPQGVGARLVRRLGGAVRSAIVGGLNLAGARRRPPVSQTSCNHAAAQHPKPSAPSRPPVPPRPHLLARLLARRHRGAASVHRPPFLNRADAPFTPQAYPQLSPKACAVLNTPLKECDPETLKLLFSALAQHMNELMSPEAAMADPEAMLPNLWHRLSTVLGDTEADDSLPATPQAIPATRADTMPRAPVLPPHSPVQAPPTGPSAKDAPRAAQAPPSAPPASDPPADAAITAPAPKTTPDIAAPCAPVGHASPRLSNPGRSFRYDTQFFARRRPRLFRSCRPLFPRGVRDGLQCLPRPCRLCCTAPTGPP